MLRIIHLTDFHLNKSNLKDWKNFVKDPMIAKLIDLHKKSPIGFIAFTGDMIDKGGIEYASPEIAFELFKTEVIMPILQALELPVNRFLIIPGNHDLVRSKDTEPIELGYSAFFDKNYKNVNDFIDNVITKEELTGVARMSDYKEFERKLYAEIDNVSLTYFGSSFKLDIQGVSVGVSCLNSSWRCYSDKTDSGKLFIGEEQLAKNTKYISKCDIKIALVHHPLDWLSIAERGTITNHISKDFDILLTGHVHENMTSVHTGFTNTLFTNVAPSGLNDIRSDSRIFSNGFTIIDFDRDKKNISCEYLRYNHNAKDFVFNTDAGNNGVFKMAIPTEDSVNKKELLKTLIANIKEDHFKEMDDHLIGQKAENHVSSNIKDGFILPPIDKGNYSKDDDTETYVGISESVKSKVNLMFFGNQESGKTTLLYRLVREFVDEYEYLEKIPVYIDFEEMGNKEFESSIKEYLRCSSEEVRALLKDKKIVLLLDNLNFKKNVHHERINKFHRFAEKDENIDLLIIATAEAESQGILPSDYLSISKLTFKNYFIKSLKAKEIKCLMRTWLPEEDALTSEQRLDRMVTSFNSYALPSTAMAVSLFIWSTENKERKPINHAVLLEIYIEIILEKLNKENVYREKFDFTNKMQLLAKIAEEMLTDDQPNFSILYSKFEKIVEDYLKKLVGFDFEADVIVRYFLDRKLFVKHQGNRIKFTYSCYFHFFLAKRMEYNLGFKDFILTEKEYYKRHKEIDYYTALTRSDEKVFELMLDRFEARFKSTDFILEKVDIDDYFTPTIKKDEPNEPIIKNIEINKLTENRPSEKMMEEFQNKRLEAIEDPNTILKEDGDLTLEILLKIMSNVLRNSEGVENLELKRRAYDSIIKYSMVFMILYKESLVDYVLKNKKLPPSIPFEINLGNLLKNIPYLIQLSLYSNLGTAKLSPVILDKIKLDEQKRSITNSDIESFLSVTLYSDIQGSNYPKYLKNFVKRIGGNIVKDYILFKLIEYYNKRTKPGSENEETYLDIMAELKVKTQSLPRILKSKMLKLLDTNKKPYNRRPEI